MYTRTKYLNSAVDAFYTALDSYNRVFGDYQNEQALILMANALELLAKAVLLKLGKPIHTRNRQETISGEKAVSKLEYLKEMEKIEAQGLQQVISLRNAASHSYLPRMSDNIMQHLIFVSFKSFKNLIEKHFRNKKLIFRKNFLSVSTDATLTYADSVESLLRKFRKGSSEEKALAWLLDRGVSFDGTKYISQRKFEQSLLKKKGRVLGRVSLGEYTQKAEQIRIIFVQAPKGYTANIEIRKGPKKGREALPVMVKKTDIATDYPHLTSDIAKKLDKSINFIARAVRTLGLYGDDKHHQSVHGKMQLYSDAALNYLKKYFTEHKDYNPYKIK